MKLRLIATALLCMSISQFASSQSGPKPNIRLRLSAAEDGRTDMFPLSVYYSGMLINEGDKAVSLDAVQMPGGYVGSGRFFPCVAQVWNSHKQTWDTPHPAMLSDYEAGQVISVNVRPGEKLEVCKRLLPQQEGHSGDKGRFALALRWSQRPSLFSNTFRLGLDCKNAGCAP
jgi:hypothetical protein